MSGTTPEDHEKARRLAESGLRQQQAGDDSAAEKSLDQAMQLDPDAVVEVLHETGADTAPDARDSSADRDVTPPDAFHQKPA